VGASSSVPATANRHSIFYLLRPYLKDADDDFILELAFSSAADYIITYNTDNFKRSKTFGVEVITFYSNYFYDFGKLKPDSIVAPVCLRHRQATF
jgi:predicted nucleic acid-binding protein